MVIGLLADGHLLIEGLPGLAKTRAVKAMAKHLKADFSRIQFTPDLLPSDVTGTDIYYSEGGKGEFRFQPGPVFGNILLADEINRAPAKVQAALLEAMEERQVTVGQTHPCPARPLHRHGHPEPDRAGRHLSAARGADRPLPDEGPRRLPRARRRDSASSASSAPRSRPPLAAEAGGRRAEHAGRRRRSPSTTSSPPAARSPRSTSPRRSRPTSSTSSTRPATRTSTPPTSPARSSSAPAPAPASRSTAAAAPTPGCRAPTSSPRRRPGRSPPTSSATASRLSYEARAPGRDADAVLADLLKLVAPA